MPSRHFCAAYVPPLAKKRKSATKKNPDGINQKCRERRKRLASCILARFFTHTEPAHRKCTRVNTVQLLSRPVSYGSVSDKPAGSVNARRLPAHDKPVPCMQQPETCALLSLLFSRVSELRRRHEGGINSTVTSHNFPENFLALQLKRCPLLLYVL